MVWTLERTASLQWQEEMDLRNSAKEVGYLRVGYCTDAQNGEGQGEE